MLHSHKDDALCLVTNLIFSCHLWIPSMHPLQFWFQTKHERTLHIIEKKSNKKVNQKDIKAINKVKDVVCFLLSCRKYFCKYVESYKVFVEQLLPFDDGDKNNNVQRNLCWRTCGCAIHVHLRLDLLKFYLAILKPHSLVSVSVKY